MVPVIAVTSRLARRAIGVVRGAVRRTGVRHADRRRPDRVRDAVVHGARMQCRWLLLNHEGPGREDRGDRATTRGPLHCDDYYRLAARIAPA